ncbi:SMP-30/gluconolactonase/LRE family protein [Luteipulveratus sp. YIM 133132]|uniref:SMP-30/gluconolactonase/LRE family protein n=1 Tax=Luteipulveratus flavus TaxID=3031728 RepID=UPI0023B1BAFA|nr:SMP-30/gluconolactonase/LRE family protein [Luteipulveratus sp. YIM 133132]MDE9364151.1 SMP-30/gluconolactonase/LRE family protein [Luteipulveratus sp. YIM 133132]
MRAEAVSKPHAFHAEGPVWWPDGRLRYVDLMAGDVLTLLDDGSVERAHVGEVAAALRPRASGGAVIAVERGFALATSDDLSDITPLPELWSGPIRFNDGGCDPAGRFYCGSMAYDQSQGQAFMYRLDPDGSATRVLDDLTISNGLGWSASGETAYFNDTPTRTISAFDWSEADGLTRRRAFVRLPDDLDGDPDGLCIDADGGVWVALYGGSAVHRYTPDGQLDQVVELPVTNVTACTFGGPDLRTLYVTTTRENVPDGEQPAAGAVFTCEPGAAGLPASPFAG